MPSKLLGMMASSIPSLVTGNLQSEVAKVFDESDAGAFFDSQNLNGCCVYIQKLCLDRSVAARQGENARKFVLKHFSRDSVLPKFEQEVTSMTGSKP